MHTRSRLVIATPVVDGVIVFFLCVTFPPSRNLKVRHLLFFKYYGGP